MSEWAIAIAVMVGTLLGVGIQEFRRWRESRERYQVMTFPKRLEAHQQAFSWCHALNVVLNRSDPEEIHKVADEARAWWNDNCFLLDTDSRRKMIPLFNVAHIYAEGIERGKPLDVQLGDSVWRYLEDALKAITKGVGDKYLPETSTPEVLEQEDQREAKLPHLSREHLLQRYMVSQVPTFFFFGSLSLIAHHLIVQRATAVMSIGEKAQYVLGWLSLPLGIIAILWAIALLAVGLNLKILSKAKRVESVITGLIEGDNELFYYIATVTVFGISFASVLVLMIQVGMDDLYIYILFGVALLLLMSFVYNIYLSARQRKLPKNSKTQSSEPHNHDA